MLWAVANAPAEVQRALGVGQDELAAATAALTSGNEKPAAAVMNDERLSQVMLIGEPTTVGRRLAELVRRHRPNAIGLALLQQDLASAVASAAAAFETMRGEL
jgi:hypothetical protein